MEERAPFREYDWSQLCAWARSLERFRIVKGVDAGGMWVVDHLKWVFRYDDLERARAVLGSLDAREGLRTLSALFLEHEVTSDGRQVRLELGAPPVGRYLLSEESVARGQELESLVRRELGEVEDVSPPFDHEHCLCPERYPKVFV